MKKCIKCYLTRPAYPFKVSSFMIPHKEALFFGLNVHWIVRISLDVGVTDDHKLSGHRGLKSSSVTQELYVRFYAFIIVWRFKFYSEITTRNDIFKTSVKPYPFSCLWKLKWYQNQASALLQLLLPSQHMFSKEQLRSFCLRCCPWRVKSSLLRDIHRLTLTRANMKAKQNDLSTFLMPSLPSLGPQNPSIG